MSSLLELDYMIRTQIENAISSGLDNVTISFPPITHSERVVMSKIPGLQTTDIWERNECRCNDDSPYAWCICRGKHVAVNVSWTNQLK